jgi:hypothetical protein
MNRRERQSNSVAGFSRPFRQKRGKSAPSEAAAQIWLGQKAVIFH